MNKLLQNIKLITVLLVAIAATSCGEDNHTPEVVFPELQTIECEVGEMPSFGFKANDSWQLSSDAIWCSMLTPSGKVLDMSGDAGTHTITLSISSEGIKQEATTATITMKMGGKEAVVANVVRAAEAHTLTIYDADGKQCDVITLGYNKFVTFSVEANFRFAATSFPEWVEFENGSVTGGRDQRVESGARIVANGDRERYAIGSEAGHVVTFSDESGKTTFDIPLVFDGMGEDDITISSDMEELFGWDVSLDGTKYRRSESKEEYNGEFKYTITARNDEYEIVTIEMVIDRGIPTYSVDADWITFDKSNSTVSIAPATKSRYGMVLAFPMGIYNDIKGDIKSALFELDYTSGIALETLKYDYLKYTLLDFVQKDFASVGEYDGMYVYHSLTTYEIPCEKYNDASVMAEYGVSDAYTCPFVNSVEGKIPGIIIDPRIEGWDSASHDSGSATAEVWYNGERLRISDGEYYIGENTDENLAVHLWGPNGDFTECVYIVFKFDNIAKKLLVVTPPVK